MQSLRESKQAFSPTSQASGRGAQLSPQVLISLAGLDTHDNTQGSVLRGCASPDCLIQVLPCIFTRTYCGWGGSIVKMCPSQELSGTDAVLACIVKLEMSLQCAETSGAAAKDP